MCKHYIMRVRTLMRDVKLSERSIKIVIPPTNNGAVVRNRALKLMESEQFS